MNISAIGTPSTISYTFQYRRRSREMREKKRTRKTGCYPGQSMMETPRKLPAALLSSKRSGNAFIAAFSMERGRRSLSVLQSGCFF